MLNNMYSSEKKLEAQSKVRDMAPYVEILKSFSKYYNAGEDIVIFEIGVRRAVSTKYFLTGLLTREYMHIGTGHLYSVDIDDREKYINDEDLKSRWTFIQGNSTKILWDKQIDILFIDGDHSYDGCKKDYEKYEPFVKPGGIIIMHDITCRHYGVKDLWKEIKYPKVNIKLNTVGLGIINKPEK